MIKEYLNEANGVYEKNYETDLPEKYHCTECLAEIKKDLREELKDDGYSKEEIKNELESRFYPVKESDEPIFCEDCGQFIGKLSKKGKEDILKKAEENGKVVIEKEYSENVCYFDFGDYNKESTYFELFDAYGLTAASEKIAKKKCDEYIKNHPKEELENGHK